MPVPSQAEEPPESPSPEQPQKGKHGGARPGSGAPRGNLNALKHGLRSRQFAAIGKLLAEDPKVREALLAMAGKHQLKQRKAQHVAAALLASLMERANAVAGGRLNVEAPIDDWQAIKSAAAEITPSDTAAALEILGTLPEQPRSERKRSRTTKNQIRKALD